MDDNEPTALSLSTTSSDVSDPPRRYTASPTRKGKKRRNAARRPPLPFFQTARSAVNARIDEMSALACSVNQSSSDTGVRQKASQERGSQQWLRRPATRASKNGRSCSADDASVREVAPEMLCRHSANKMAEASDPKKSDSSKRVKRRVKGSLSCEGKGEERGEGKVEAKSETKKVSSRSVVRRSANSEGVAAGLQPVIRVKVSPSGTHKVVGDNERLLAAGRLAEGSAASQEAAVSRRRVTRRKTKGKQGDSEGGAEGAVAAGAGAGAGAGTGTNAAVASPAATATAASAATAATAASLLRSAAAPAALATSTASSRTSPLHCAFLNALKECSPRLIAALSATNEAAFLNAMWSCFWRGYRAGFQASVRELEATSGLSVASNPAAAAAASAALEAAPKGHSEKKRHVVRATPDATDYSAKV